MRTLSRVLLTAALVAGLAACTSNDKTDAGGVSIALGTLPSVPDHASVSSLVAGGNELRFDVNLRSIVLHPAGSSDLMDIRIESYEVTYTRGDGGTKVPPPLVLYSAGNLPAGGTLTINGLLMLGPDQITTSPISDLMFVNGGLDRETGKPSMTLNMNLRFFGHTVGGQAIESPVFPFSIVLEP